MDALKPDYVKIIDITSKDNCIFGLGDDNLVYMWMAETHEWRVWA